MAFSMVSTVKSTWYFAIFSILASTKSILQLGNNLFMFYNYNTAIRKVLWVNIN
jgi:hypothetical protein